MSEQAEADRTQLTSYETEQVAEIAAWKSEPPNPIVRVVEANDAGWGQRSSRS